jgi:hypothetical protein
VQGRDPALVENPRRELRSDRLFRVDDLDLDKLRPILPPWRSASRAETDSGHVATDQNVAPIIVGGLAVRSGRKRFEGDLRKPREDPPSEEERRSVDERPVEGERDAPRARRPLSERVFLRDLGLLD